MFVQFTAFVHYCYAPRKAFLTATTGDGASPVLSLQLPLYTTLLFTVLLLDTLLGAMPLPAALELLELSVVIAASRALTALPSTVAAVAIASVGVAASTAAAAVALRCASACAMLPRVLIGLLAGEFLALQLLLLPLLMELRALLLVALVPLPLTAAAVVLRARWRCFLHSGGDCAAAVLLL
jgi:hypothetical protein